MTDINKQSEYKRKRRRMKKFTMTEISAVDRPAQYPALAVIMKRDNNTEIKEDIEKRGRFSIRDI